MATLTQITLKDAGNTTRTVWVTSDTGAITGNLSFLQTIAGEDGANPANLTNAFPVQGNISISGTPAVTVTSGNIAIPAGVSVTGGSVGLLGGTATIGNIAGINSPVSVTGNLTSGGNVTVTSGNITATLSGNSTAAGLADSVEPPKATANTTTDIFLDLVGKQVTSPYANRENYVRGGNTTGNTTTMVLLTAAGGVLKNYVTSIQLGNTGNTTVNVTFNDVTQGGSSSFIVPGGGGNNPPLTVPLVTAANTALTATLSGSSPSVTVNVQGYTGY